MPVTGQTVDPIADFRFEVQIEGVVAGWFTECSGVVISREVKSHPEGGVNDYVHQLPGPIKQQNITLKQGVVSQALWDWLHEGRYDGKVKFCHVSVILRGTDHAEAHRWELIEAYPGKWSGIQMKSDSNQLVLESLELVQQGNEETPVQRSSTELEIGKEEKSASGSEIDVESLARKVYSLFREDIRVERDRLGW